MLIFLLRKELKVEMMLQIKSYPYHTQPNPAVHKLTAFLMQVCVHKMNALMEFRWQDLYYRKHIIC